MVCSKSFDVNCVIKKTDVTTILRKFMQDKTINRNSSFMISRQFFEPYQYGKLIFKDEF